MSSLYDEFLIALHGVWNRRWLALAVAWGVCMLGWLVIAMIPNSYESKAKVYVASQSLLSGKIGITPIEQKQDMDRVQQTLASAENLERIVRSTDLAQSVSNDRDVAGKVAALRNNIKVVSTQDNVFEISASSSDSTLSDGANARIANQITQKLVDIFQEENVMGDRDETKQGLKFLNGQIDAKGKQLAEADQRRVQFQQQYAGLLPGAGSISQRMDAARTELNNIDSQLIQAQSALTAMNGQLAGTPQSIPGVGPSGGPSALSQAQGQLAQAKANGWTDSHPDVIALKRQIAALKAQGGGAGAGAGSTPNPLYLSVKSMQAEKQATVQALQARKAQIQADLGTMAEKQTSEPGIAAEGEKLDRDYDALKDQYDKLLSDREDIRLRGDAQTETDSVSFRVIQPPTAPTSPAAPNRPLLLIAVMIVGIGAGVGSAFAMGQVRTTFPTASRLERAAGLPVIGSITETLTPTAYAARKQKLRWFLSASGALAASCLLLIVVEFVQRSMA